MKSSELAIHDVDACMRYIEAREILDFVAVLMLEASKYQHKDFILPRSDKFSTFD